MAEMHHKKYGQTEIPHRFLAISRLLIPLYDLNFIYVPEAMGELYPRYSIGFNVPDEALKIFAMIQNA